MPYQYLKLLILRIQKIMLGIKISGHSVRIDYIIDKINWLHSTLKVLAISAQIFRAFCAIRRKPG